MMQTYSQLGGVCRVPKPELGEILCDICTFKNSHFWLFWGWNRVVVNTGTVGQNDFFNKIRCLVKSILALEPKFHEDLSKNG